MTYRYQKTGTAARRWLLCSLTTAWQSWDALLDENRAALTDNGETPWALVTEWLGIARREGQALGEVITLDSDDGLKVCLTQQGERAQIAEFMLQPVK